MADPFYNLVAERILDWDLTPQTDVDIPTSSLQLEAILIPKHLGSIADRYHVTWLVTTQDLLTQVFSTEAGVFDHDSYVEITLRHHPRDIQIKSCHLKTLLRHHPRITAYRLDENNHPIQIDQVITATYRLKFKRTMTSLDWFWEGAKLIPEYTRGILDTLHQF